MNRQGDTELTTFLLSHAHHPIHTLGSLNSKGRKDKVEPNFNILYSKHEFRYV